MNSTMSNAMPPVQTAPAKPILPMIFALIGPFIGWIGALMVLGSIFVPGLAMIARSGDFLMSVGPMLTAPGLVRAGWSNHQPSWVIGAAAFIPCWTLYFAMPSLKGLAIGVLIFMVGFLFAGLSNDVAPEKRQFNLSQWNPLGFLGFIKDDILLTFKIAFQGFALLLLYPAQLVVSLLQGKGLPAMPWVFSPNHLWASRRMGAFTFSLAGLCSIVANTIPEAHAIGNQLFDIVGGIGAIMMNYSLFNTGLKGKHWLEKLLLFGSVFATIGSSARSTTWGVACDQFGSRMNEMYYSGSDFIKEKE
ncbi:MAG: hypothetical protein H2174_08875 [Vampirovibrio sp.]|jgi:hypothetical protein|nr:hypothetical protein [Vampirovibrio sp.]